MRRAMFRRVSKPVLKPKAESFSNGWLSPDGTYFECPAQGHLVAADVLAGASRYDGEKILESRGWAKVSDNRWFAVGRQELTQGQIDFIFDWCQINKRVYPPPFVHYIIEDMEA